MCPMATVKRWTGAETKALRQAMRLSIRAFAAHLGVDARTVNKWEARSNTITLLPDTQALLDTALSRAPGDVQTRFSHAMSNLGDSEQEQGGAYAQQLTTARLSNAPGIVVQWNRHSITSAAQQIIGEDLSIRRRDTLGASVAIAGRALTEPLQRWLLPLDQDAESASYGPNFSPAELALLEGLVGKFRGWSNSGNGSLIRRAAVAQLNDVTDRLRKMSPGPASWRAFSVGAELSEVIASMSWDAGLHRSAQRYYILSVQLAKLADDDGLAAVVLAALARQCYDLGQPRDGLEIAQLAQYGSRKTATSLLRAMLATREAWGYAQLGEPQAFHRAVGLAEDYFSDGPSESEPRSVQYFDAAELAGVIGGRYRDLARHEPRWARKAQDYIQQALRLRHPSRPRLRAFDLIGLARTHLITADPQHACELVHQALPLAQRWANGRVGAKLREFRQEVSQYAGIPVVEDTRDLIRDNFLS